MCRTQICAPGSTVVVDTVKLPSQPTENWLPAETLTSVRMAKPVRVTGAETIWALRATPVWFTKVNSSGSASPVMTVNWPCTPPTVRKARLSESPSVGVVVRTHTVSPLLMVPGADVKSTVQPIE